MQADSVVAPCIKSDFSALSPEEHFYFGQTLVYRIDPTSIKLQSAKQDGKPFNLQATIEECSFELKSNVPLKKISYPRHFFKTELSHADLLKLFTLGNDEAFDALSQLANNSWTGHGLRTSNSLFRIEGEKVHLYFFEMVARQRKNIDPSSVESKRLGVSYHLKKMPLLTYRLFYTSVPLSQVKHELLAASAPHPQLEQQWARDYPLKEVQVVILKRDESRDYYANGREESMSSYLCEYEQEGQKKQLTLMLNNAYCPRYDVGDELCLQIKKSCQLDSQSPLVLHQDIETFIYLDKEAPLPCK